MCSPWLRPLKTVLRNEKTAQRESFQAGYPVEDVLASFVWTSRRINFGRPSKPWKSKHLGADVHEPNMRTSMTPGGSKELRTENFGLIFRSLSTREMKFDRGQYPPQVARRRTLSGTFLQDLVVRAYLTNMSRDNGIFMRTRQKTEVRHFCLKNLKAARYTPVNRDRKLPAFP